MNYNTYNSTTNTKVDIFYDVSVKTNTQSETHFSTKVYLEDGQTFVYNYDFNIAEGWHVKQHYITVGNHTELLYSIVEETGNYLGNNKNPETVLRNIFQMKKTFYNSGTTQYKISMWIALPLLIYFIHFAFPKIFNNQLPMLIQIIITSIWLALCLFVNIFEVIKNKEKNYYAYLKYREEEANSKIYYQTLSQQLDPIIYQCTQLDIGFKRHGMDFILNILD